MDDIKGKAKDFMKKFGSNFGAPRTFKGQGHRLGSDPPSASTPSPRTNPSFTVSPSVTSSEVVVEKRQKGSLCSQQKTQQGDWRKVQQEKWERERGVNPSVGDTITSNSSGTRNAVRSHEFVTLKMNQVESASLRVDAEARSHGLQRKLDVPPVNVPLIASETGSSPQFDVYSPMIASTRTVSGNVNNKLSESPEQVQCPICGHWWKSEQEVSAHIDDCVLNRHGDEVASSGKSRGLQEESSDKDLEDAVSFFLSGGPSTATIDVILRLLRNIVSDPSADKFRKVRLGNPKIRETVGSAIGGLKTLECVGFKSVVEAGDDFAVMRLPTKEQLRQLDTAIIFLESYVSAKASSTAAALSQPSESEAIAPKDVDRQLQVFYATKDNLESRFEVPDSFYELSVAEVKLESAARKKKLEESQLLIPKSLREKQAAARRNYKATVIRVQLQHGIMLQGIFHPKEPTTALYQFVASTLKDQTESFELISPLIKYRTIPSGPDATGQCLSLDDVELVPKALIKLKPTGPKFSGISSEYLQMCKPLIVTTLLMPGAIGNS